MTESACLAVLDCDWNPCIDKIDWTNDQGMTCSDYRAKGYCEMITPNLGSLKQESLKYGGSHFNFPEHNCCDCGIEESP